MKPRNIEAIYRLTPLQEGLLFHTLDAATPGAYFDQYSATLAHGIKTDWLRQAWQEVVAQHAVLRTFFTWEKRDHPIQVVRAIVEVPFVIDDLRSLTRLEQQAHLADYLQRDREAGFVLDQAPLMRIRLVLLAESRVRMIWSFHHLILDGWSVRLLLAELQQHYDAIAAGKAYSGKVAPTFEQFVNWQQQQDAVGAQRYWQKYLQGFHSASTPRVVSDAAAEVSIGTALQTRVDLPIDLNARLASFARESRITLNSMFVAAWGLVLSRYCDRSDVVFGTTAAGRPPSMEGVERTAGLFIATLPVRITLRPEQTVLELLTTLQQDQTRHRDHDYVGLNVIQKASDVTSGMPLFETLLVFENFPAFTEAQDHRFQFEDERFSEYSHYPLALLVVPGNSTQLIAVHQPRHYSKEAVQRLLANVKRALEELITTPDVGRIDVLDAEQRNQLIAASFGPVEALPPITVLDEFERCVREHPDHTAVVVANEKFSYTQIDSMAHRVAQELVSDAQGNTCAVVIVCERNQWAIAAQVASLKAGKVYVALDAKEPAARINYVLADVARAFGDGSGKDAATLITTDSLQQSGGQVTGAHRSLVIDQLSNAGARVDLTGFRAGHGDEPAYVIYTSGSTGQPKGVLVSHQSLANSTLARNDFYPQSPASFALLSSLATDSSIAGVYWTLCTGGTLVMPAERAELDIAALIQLFVARKVTHTLCVPSLYGLMLDQFEAEQCPSLGTVIVAGEACPLSLVKRHSLKMSNVSLYNEYGPSEACVWVTAAQLKSTDSSVSIGRPIMNTRAVVLDSQQRLTPSGVIGELYVGGANLALEYINQPQATNRAFMHLALPESSRFYRTGDKVVLTGGGQIDYLGRVDNQLKVRGFRVEPGEVEAALCLQDEIQAAVVVIDEGSVDKALEAMLAAAQNHERTLIEQTLSEIEGMGDTEVEHALTKLAEEVGTKAHD